MQRLKYRQKKDMINLMTQTIATFTFQAVLCFFILQNTVLASIGDIKQDEMGMTMAITRFVTGISMHVLLTSSMNQGLQKMKFALNHQWKLMRWKYAFLSGFLKFTINFLVALISYFAIIFAETEIDVVKDFLALKVIADIDQLFFMEYVEHHELCKQIVCDEEKWSVL